MKLDRQTVLAVISWLVIFGSIIMLGLAIDTLLTRWGVYDVIFYWVNHIWGV